MWSGLKSPESPAKRSTAPSVTVRAAVVKASPTANSSKCQPRGT